LGHKRGSPPRGTLMDSRNADFGIDLAFMEKRDALLTELSAWPEICGSSAVDTQHMALRLWREQQSYNSPALETTALDAPRGAGGVLDAPRHPNYHRQIPSTPKPRVSNIVRSTFRDCKCKRCGAGMFQIHLFVDFTLTSVVRPRVPVPAAHDASADGARLQTAGSPDDGNYKDVHRRR
jgi:hypothetical protein